MMKGRTGNEIMAASKIDEGTDVNYGELTRKMAKNIEQHPNADVQYNHEVIDFNRRQDGIWEVKVRNRNNGSENCIRGLRLYRCWWWRYSTITKLVSLKASTLVDSISGQFLICTNPEVINEHDVKVYGKEPPGTPPMTVPHLDTRYIDGERTLLFGPFANIGPKFLKWF